MGEVVGLEHVESLRMGWVASGHAVGIFERRIVFELFGEGMTSRS